MPGVRRTYSVGARDRAALTLRVVAHEPGGPGNKITLDPVAHHHVFVGEEAGAVPLLTIQRCSARRTRTYLGMPSTTRS